VSAASEPKAEAIELSQAAEILAFPQETVVPMYRQYPYTRYFLMSPGRGLNDFVLPLPGCRVRRAAELQFNDPPMTIHGQ
jgi:hypothetical protein